MKLIVIQLEICSAMIQLEICSYRVTCAEPENWKKKYETKENFKEQKRLLQINNNI